MKKTITLLLILSLCRLAFSKPVDEATAKLVGQNFLISKTSSTLFKNGISLELSFTSTSKLSNPLATIKATNYFYVFNVSNGDGYVIVSADDNATPILGYSDEVDFNPNNIPINAQKWLESYKNEIRYIIQNNISATNDLTKDWEQLVSGKVTNNSLAKMGSVSPLIQTEWDQSPFYNALCPYDNSANERTVSGCVATAMAQIMKFWNYPVTGTGSHSYNHSKYGTLSANFGSTTYNWSSMPNRVTSSNSAVATLMYHCGVSVDMNYDIAANGGSGAQTLDVVDALKNYFGYPSSVEGKYKTDYTDAQWKSLLKSELDAGRPMQYAGTGSGGGHSFVCDGYDNNDFFHFNWGWSGKSDGYYVVNALNPGGLGTGGGTGGFNTNQRVIIGIKPPIGTQTLDMRLYSAITINPNPIEYGNGFSVTANFANYGANASKNFTGDLAAAIFNSSNQFVSYIQIKTGYTLNFNSYFSNPIVFTTNNISALTPGNYTIGVYYKPTGTQQWIAFANGSYQNFKSVEVKGNDVNPLKLYAAITTTPNIITRNQTFTVNFDVANFATSTFNGDISVDIHKSDGTWIRELSLKTGLSLPSNTHFTNGLTYTITGGIDDPAGTYQIFVWSKPTGGSWEFLGNGSFSNPINIQVKDPSLTPDSYEPNNTQNTAFNLPISFSGNTTTKTSVGSNIHLGTDYDYYKIVLPNGFNYTIEGRIHDSYNSGNSQTYTLDGLLSYSTDGITWSDAFDDIISNNIIVNGGGTVYFMVSPYFTGSTGTYLFEANITRSATTGLNNITLSELINIYPNPSSDIFYIDLKNFDGIVNTISVFDIQGKVIHNETNILLDIIKLSNLNTGIYFVHIETDKGSLNRKVIVQK